MTDRLRRYEDRSSTPLLLLALVFVAVYATPVIDPHLPVTARRVMGACSGAIWVAFALDLVVRVVLAERRWRYLATHPIDIAAVVLPALRPLRVLRVFTAGRVLIDRAGRFSLARTAQAVVVTPGLIVFLGAVGVLDAERGAKGGNIAGFGDAAWWATTTGTIMAISFLPPVSSSARRPASRTSIAWARSTSASGVPRSTATATPSAKRARAGSVVRVANPSSAVARLAPARVSARARASSRASSPEQVRATRSSAAAGPSPAATARASSSATVGNSAVIRSSRRATSRVSH